MNKIVFKLSIIDNKIALFWSFCFLVGTIISFYLSIIISTYFYFLTVPILSLTLYLIKLTITQVKDEYKQLIKKEKYFNDGRHLEYFENKKRQAKFELHVINGKRHGSYKSYYENGQIKIYSNYINGVLDGSYRHYYENGQIEVDRNYINGELDGIYKSYYENGQIKLDCNGKNGEIEGVYKSYYESGNLKNQFNYKNGSKVGQFQSFYDNKAKYREGNFGEKELVKEYFKNGNLKFLQDNNKYTFYDDDNNLKCEISDDINGFCGKWKNYREDGIIEYELDFDDYNSDKKNKRVTKTIFTKGGDFYSKNNVSYEWIKGSHMLYSSDAADSRREGGIFNQPIQWRGPGGDGGAFSIDLKPIKLIEDIIKFI